MDSLPIIHYDEETDRISKREMLLSGILWIILILGIIVAGTKAAQAETLIDDSFTVGAGANQDNIGTTNLVGFWKKGIKFTATEDIESIAVNLSARAVGNPTDKMRVQVYTHAAGPDEPLIGLFSWYDTQTVSSSSFGYVSFNITGPALDAGTYWLVVSRSGEDPDNDNHYAIERDTANSRRTCFSVSSDPENYTGCTST